MLLAVTAACGIAAEVEELPCPRVEDALARLGKGGVRYRFVLGLSDLDD